MSACVIRRDTASSATTDEERQTRQAPRDVTRAQASGAPPAPRRLWLRRRAIVPYRVYGRQGTVAVRAMSVTLLGGVWRRLLRYTYSRRMAYQEDCPGKLRCD
jgi:hypothetical protein